MLRGDPSAGVMEANKTKMAVVTANTKTKFESLPASPFPLLHRIRDFGLAAVYVDIVATVFAVVAVDAVVVDIVLAILLGAAVVRAVSVVFDGRFFMIDSKLNQSS